MTVWDIPEDSPTGQVGYLGVSCAEWSERMARRRARWAAEDAARYAELGADDALSYAAARHLARSAARGAEWPIERIRALMTAQREGCGDDLAGP